MKFLDNLLWVFFPKRCVCCGRVIERTSHLCKTCEADINKADRICIKCGASKRKCECKFTVYHFEACVAPIVRDETSMRVISNFKFRDNIDVADYLAEKMSESVSKYYGDIDFDGIFAVPMDDDKKSRKGFNQSEVLARRIAARTGVPYIDKLYKKRKTKTQHTLKRAERFENVKDAFACDKLGRVSNVLLVDDIKTTGATLDECTRELMFAGADKVYCLTALVNMRY